MNTIPLKLITTQHYEDHTNTEEQAIDAVVACRNGSQYITFKQVMPEHRIEVSNLIKFKDGKVTIKRSGALSSHMEFEVGKPYATDYETPYGKLDVRVQTQEVVCEVLQDDVNLKICYEMIMQGNKISDNMYSITCR